MARNPKLVPLEVPFGTRIVTLSPALLKLIPRGYSPAYARLTQDAVVIRREVKLEDDPAAYKVLNVKTNTFEGNAATTREAGVIMKAMGARKRAAAHALAA